MILKSISQNLGPCLTNKKAWAAAGVGACVITGIVLLILAIHSLHFGPLNNNIVDSLGRWHAAQDSILLTNNVKLCALFCSAGAAFGAGVFIIKKMLTTKIAEKLEHKPWREKALAASSFINTLFAISAIVAAGIMLYCSIHYLFTRPDAFMNGNVIGSFVWKKSIIICCKVFASGGLLGAFGVLELCHVIATRKIQNVVAQPTNDLQQL